MIFFLIDSKRKGNKIKNKQVRLHQIKSLLYELIYKTGTRATDIENKLIIRKGKGAGGAIN